jgi:hypothetical protein
VKNNLILIAQAKNGIGIQRKEPSQRPITSIQPQQKPTASISLIRNQSPINPRDILKNPTGPLASSNCSVDFSDYDALELLPDFAMDSFAYSPWWFQSCSGNPGGSHAVVRPIGDSHFHLAYDNPHILPCNGDLTQWGLLQEDDTCDVIEPREEPRFLHPHASNVTTHIYIWDGFGKRFFRLNSIRVENENAIRLCYKPVQEDDGPWETSEPDGTTSPGIWFCWNELTTGNWDLSEWTDYITEVKIVSTYDGIYAIDDIEMHVY